MSHQRWAGTKTIRYRAVLFPSAKSLLPPHEPEALAEDTARPPIFPVSSPSNENTNEQRGSISPSGCSASQQQQSSWKSPPMPGKLQPRTEGPAGYIKHAVSFCFSLPLAGKTVSTLGIFLHLLYCQLAQSFNYWFRCWGGGETWTPPPR